MRDSRSTRRPNPQDAAALDEGEGAGEVFEDSLPLELPVEVTDGPGDPPGDSAEEGVSLVLLSDETAVLAEPEAERLSVL